MSKVHSEYMKSLWANANYKSKQLSYLSSEQRKKSLSRSTKLWWSNPKTIDMMSRITKETWQDPIIRSSRLKGRKKPWNKGLTKYTDKRILSIAENKKNLAYVSTIWGTVCKHGDHAHRSKSEYFKCLEYGREYGSMLIPNVRVKNIEIDFAVGPKREDPSTWSRVMEYHVIKSWFGETGYGYVDDRLNSIRSLGINCLVEFCIPIPNKVN
jgi:hypothetical protein